MVKAHVAVQAVDAFSRDRQHVTGRGSGRANAARQREALQAAHRGEDVFGGVLSGIPRLDGVRPYVQHDGVDLIWGGQGRAGPAAGVARRQADGLDGLGLAASAAVAGACRCSARGARFAGRSRTSAVHGARHPARRASGAPARPRRCAVSVRLACWAGWGLWIAVQCRAASMRASGRPIAASLGAAPKCRPQQAPSSQEGRRGRSEAIDAAVRSVQTLCSAIRGLGSRRGLGTDRRSQPQPCTAAPGRRRDRQTRRRSRPRPKRWGDTRASAAAAARCPPPLPSAETCFSALPSHLPSPRRPPCLASWRGRCWPDEQRGGMTQRAWAWRPSWWSCTQRCEGLPAGDVPCCIGCGSTAVLTGLLRYDAAAAHASWPTLLQAQLSSPLPVAAHPPCA